jgi:hypothetical protein
MVDRRLIARLDAARVSFCLVGERARAHHDAGHRDGDVELLVVDDAVLRPLFWDGAPTPRVRLGGPGDPDLGALRWELEPPHQLRVGRNHAAVFTVDTARHAPELGCRVATPLGLVLLALEHGPRSRAEVVQLVRAQEARIDRPWRPDVAPHLRQMSAAARATWHQAELDLGVPA